MDLQGHPSLEVEAHKEIHNSSWALDHSDWSLAVVARIDRNSGLAPKAAGHSSGWGLLMAGLHRPCQV
jgi:hypothetical protein